MTIRGNDVDFVTLDEIDAIARAFDMSREDVYDAIDSEREYQEDMVKDANRQDIIEDFHIGDTIAALQYNLDLARIAWYTGQVPHEGSMQYLRKIAALCVKAGERYGMPFRER